MDAHATDPKAWEGLFITEAGVAAVLAGLLSVAVSINLGRILLHPGLPGRAAEAIGLLTGVLVACTLGLVPGQPRALLGAGLLTTGVLAWLVQVGIHLRAVRDRVGPSPAARIGRIGLAQAAVLPLPVAGLSLLLGPAAGGTGWSPDRPVAGGRGAGRVGAADRDPAVNAMANQPASHDRDHG
jgi:hypothetical protein